MRLRPYRPSELRALGMTNLGYLFGVPVYLGNVDTDGPTVLARQPLLDPLLEGLSTLHLLINQVSPAHMQLAFPLRLGPSIPGLDRD